MNFVWFTLKKEKEFASGWGKKQVNVSCYIYNTYILIQIFLLENNTKILIKKIIYFNSMWVNMKTHPW